MSDKNYYDVLGVSKTASKKEISDAYKRLVKKHHPDLNPSSGSEEEIKKINQAYEILKNDQKRAQYDQLGHNNFNSSGGASSSSYNYSSFSSEDGFDIFDMFDDFMGGTSRKKKKSFSQPGATIRYTIPISLEDAFLGSEKNISYVCLVACENCDGSGSLNKKFSTCYKCKGSGSILMQQGFFQVRTTCTVCKGQGNIIKDPCNFCSSEGVVSKERKIKLKIPKGVRDKDVINIKEKGDLGIRGGKTGDLNVVISIKQNKFFRLDGADVYCSYHLPFWTFVLGDDLMIDFLAGEKFKIKIPKGSANASQMVLRGKGMPLRINSSHRGDFFVTVYVKVPKNVSKEEEDLVLSMKNLDSKKQKDKDDNFFSKMKNLW